VLQMWQIIKGQMKFGVILPLHPPNFNLLSIIDFSPMPNLVYPSTVRTAVEHDEMSSVHQQTNRKYPDWKAQCDNHATSTDKTFSLFGEEHEIGIKKSASHRGALFYVSVYASALWLYAAAKKIFAVAKFYFASAYEINVGKGLGTNCILFKQFCFFFVFLSLYL
jgi:hypothetical protein